MGIRLFDIRWDQGKEGGLGCDLLVLSYLFCVCFSLQRGMGARYIHLFPLAGMMGGRGPQAGRVGGWTDGSDRERQTGSDFYFSFIYSTISTLFRAQYLTYISPLGSQGVCMESCTVRALMSSIVGYLMCLWRYPPAEFQCPSQKSG